GALRALAASSVEADMPPSPCSRSNSGWRSISPAMNNSSSTCVSCSRRIDCSNCGVITNDWLCRRFKLGERAILTPTRGFSLFNSLGFATEDKTGPVFACQGKGEAPGPCSPAGSECEAFAKIKAAHVRIADDVLRPPMRKHLTSVDDIGAVDKPKCLAHIVIGDENSDSAGG